MERGCDCATCASRGGCFARVYAGRCQTCREGIHRPLVRLDRRQSTERRTLIRREADLTAGLMRGERSRFEGEVVEVTEKGEFA